jgi:hypothetical protein
MDQHQTTATKHTTNYKIIQAIILAPRHVSLPPRQQQQQAGNNPFHYRLNCHRPGVLWKGLALLWEAPRKTAQHTLQCIWESSNPSLFLKDPPHDENNKDDDIKDVSNQYLHRQLQLVAPCNGNAKTIQNITERIVIWCLPPILTNPDMTFTRALLRMEHAVIKTQTLSAWYATLGGGYFFCRRLGHSLQLARQQRVLAKLLGDAGMERTCSINEAYNLLYAGRFKEALLALRLLWKSSGDDVTRNQCQAAWLLGKRLRKASRKLVGYHQATPTQQLQKHFTDTVDDYQRIRIVKD